LVWLPFRYEELRASSTGASVSFPPIADISLTADNRSMYRKDAVRQIVRDVPKRLAEIRRKVPWADWQMAVLACQADHPSWFRDFRSNATELLEPHLREAGVDMSQPDKPHGWIGAVSSQ